MLYGGDGVDRLNGGTGSDIFCFLNWQTEGNDRIEDFQSGTDKLGFSNFWFGIGNAGPATAIDRTLSDFITDATLYSYRPAFLWDSALSTLRFDPDGLGSTAIATIATFAAGATLAASDL